MSLPGQASITGTGGLGCPLTKQKSFVIPGLNSFFPARPFAALLVPFERLPHRQKAFGFPPAAHPMSDAPSAAAAPSTESLEVIRKFAETYAQRTGTFFCSDSGVTAVVLEGLARHKEQLGGALCPCRHYEDKEAEVSQAFWNCPCVPMRERKECHCMLFLTQDNPFRGDTQSITLSEIRSHTNGSTP